MHAKLLSLRLPYLSKKKLVSSYVYRACIVSVQTKAFYIYKRMHTSFLQYSTLFIPEP